jgi:hypothetical protein
MFLFYLFTCLFIYGLFNVAVNSAKQEINQIQAKGKEKKYI